MSILYLSLKDLMQIIRDWKAAFFLLVMPIVFTLFFGVIFQGGGEADDRLPVGIVDQDSGSFNPLLLELLEGSQVVRIETYQEAERMERKIANKDLAAGIIIPAGFSDSLMNNEPLSLVLRADTSSSAFLTIQGEVQASVNRLLSALRTAAISTEMRESVQAFALAEERRNYFDEAAADTIAAWQEPPVSLLVTATGESIASAQELPENGYAHTSPGMMAQFAIAGLMGAAGVVVRERKTRSLQRLLTTSVSRVEILVSHYLAMFLLIFSQFVVLIAFGQLFLNLHYDNAWGATVLVTAAMAACCAAMGLLIGVLAKSEEHTIIYTLVPMFVFSGLGGAWVPLEFTSATVQAVSHLSPVAWMMDGFKNILVRGQGLAEALLPAAALLIFTAVFFTLAAWRFLGVSE